MGINLPPPQAFYTGYPSWNTTPTYGYTQPNYSYPPSLPPQIVYVMQQPPQPASAKPEADTVETTAAKPVQPSATQVLGENALAKLEQLNPMGMAEEERLVLSAMLKILRRYPAWKDQITVEELSKLAEAADDPKELQRLLINIFKQTPAGESVQDTLNSKFLKRPFVQKALFWLIPEKYRPAVRELFNQLRSDTFQPRRVSHRTLNLSDLADLT